MSEITGRQRRVLASLDSGATDIWQIGADVQEAPFVVRAELAALSRLELVTHEYAALAGGRIHYSLTPAGERELDQGVLLT